MSALAETTQMNVSMAAGQPLAFHSIDDLIKLSQLLFKGNLKPSWCSRPEELAVVILAGQSLGLSPITAVNQIMVVGGRAVIWGDLPLALARRSGLLESIEETIEGEGKERTATCTVKRKGSKKPLSKSYSIADADKAGLTDPTRHKGKGPWATNPDRMLQFRARSLAIRDEFGDVLMGIGMREEEDTVTDAEVVSVRQATPPDATTNAPATDATQAIEDKPKPEATPSVTDATLEAIVTMRAAWYRSFPDLDQVQLKAKWTELLSDNFGVQTARELTEKQARKLYDYLLAEAQPQRAEELFTEGQ